MQYAPGMPIELGSDNRAENARLLSDRWPENVDVDRRIGEVWLSPAEQQNPVVKSGPHGSLRFATCDSWATYRAAEERAEGVGVLKRYVLDRRYDMVEHGRMVKASA